MFYRSQVVSKMPKVPSSFIRAIDSSIYIVERFLKQRFGIDYSFQNNIYILDKDTEAIEENAAIRRNFNGLIESIDKLSRKTDSSEILDLFTKLKAILNYFYGLPGDSSSVYNYLIQNMIREKSITCESVIHEISKRLSPDEQAVKDELDRLSDEISRLQYETIPLGKYFSDTGDIALYYEAIEQAAQENDLSIDELGINVLSHEIFHAAHFSWMEESGVLENPDQNMIDRNAALESLAQYCCIRFAAEKQHGEDLYDWTVKTAVLHPFPNWGYAGGSILNRAYEKRSSKYGINVTDFDFNAAYAVSMISSTRTRILLSNMNKKM